MVVRIAKIEMLANCLEKREELAKKVVKKEEGVTLKEKDELLIDYNYYVVMVEEISREIGISIEKSETTILSSRVWLKEKKGVQERNPDAWII